jgi:predicted O-linked N-acetylglucosamine transferase (SPINDLY family)
MASKIQRTDQAPADGVTGNAWPAEPRPAGAQPADDLSADAQETALLSSLARGESLAARSLASRLTQRFPGRGLAWKILGALLWAEGQVPDALAAMQQSVLLLPRDAEALCNLGTSLSKLDRFDEAERMLRAAIHIDPTFSTAHYRLGMNYSLQARLTEAAHHLRAGIALRSGYVDGDDAQNHSNLLFILSNSDSVEPQALFAEHRRFAENFENRATWPRHTNDRDANRRLKVGFVSGDFREHAVSYFFEPVVARLAARSNLELHAYSNNAAVDDVTRRLHGHFKRWHEISTLTDTQLAAKIGADGMDILVDLSGHTALNRLAAFARKPAPIQVSWIGYPGTTGLEAVDYYFADRRWLPAERFAGLFSEKLAYLPDRWTFQPYAAAPAVSALPAMANGHLTFGSFNRADKISAATRQLWARLLREMPDSRMVIGGIRLESQCRALLDAFDAAGVAPERITFHPPSDMTTHLSLHGSVDLCLDTTPFNGGTTSLHALSMGVPTLTLAGNTPMGRAGAGIFDNLALGEFVAVDTGDFIAKARYWSNHLHDLAAIRMGMRARLLGSPVGQADLLASHVAGALRHMWARWCADLPAESFDSTVAMSPSVGAAPASTDASQLEANCIKAMNLQMTGRPAEARRLYQAIIEAAPRHAAANYCLGMLDVQARRPESGLPYLKAALEAQPGVPDYWLGYLEALTLAGRTEAARNILAVGRQQGLCGPAVDEYSRRLDSVLDAECRGRESSLQSLFDRGDRAQALPLARETTQRFPERGLAWKLLGALLSQEDDPQTVEVMRTAARLLPQDVEAQVNVGLALAKKECFEEAEAYLHNALELNPTFAATHYRLAINYELQGRFADAEASLRRGIALRTGYAAREDEQCHSHLLFLMAHNESVQVDELLSEHRRYGEYVERSLRPPCPRLGNSRDPRRRLKVGFVSGDLYEHSVANFIGPVLAELKDRPSMELHVYYANTLHDEVSHRLRSSCKSWTPVRQLSDDALTATIMQDGIDVLIDLSGHTRFNRLPVFARKPAPIQVSWLGYPGTTGLHAMDYYLADRHWLPSGRFDRLFTEKLCYLPARWAFEPHKHAPEVAPLPSLRTGRLTFGSFHRMEKIGSETQRLWAELLRALPQTSLLLVGIATETQRDSLRRRFAAHGVDANRLSFHDRCPMDVYLGLHGRVDIALDAQPYSGATTTMHSLSMGVPTFTVPGPTSQSRACAGILENVGLEGFIASDGAELIDKASRWTGRLPELADLRAGMRSRLRGSASGRPDFIAQHVESALRHMWARWCEGLPAESFATDELGTVQIR